MGFWGGIDKMATADQTEKTVENSSPRSPRFRQIVAKISELTRRQPKRRGRVPFRLDFQNQMMERAGPEEHIANEVLLKRRQDDDQQAYLTTQSSKESGTQSELRFAEDHFSRNVELIEGTRLLDVARQMPKGAHLHLHFNSSLPPEFLLGIAKGMRNMYISSPTHKLRSKSDFDDCEIVFKLRDIGEVMQGLSEDPVLQEQELASKDLNGPNIFHDTYVPNQPMRYQFFRTTWNQERATRRNFMSQDGKQTDTAESGIWTMDMDCDEWLISKLIFSKKDIDLIFNPIDRPSDRIRKPETEEEKRTKRKQVEDARWPKTIEFDFQKSPYRSDRERATRAWDKFNGRTRMMKGLFNYEKAFRSYTRKCLEQFVSENIQYAEIRPNFMKSNQVLRDDGAGSFDNFGLMELIIEEYENFMKDIGDMDDDGQIKENRKLDSQGKPVYSDDGRIPLSDMHMPSLGGMKVIYCTPRSFSKSLVKEALDECIQMKKKWPQYIAGFDLVGEEAYDKPYPLRYFEEEFRQFQDDCEREDVKIPFLFHCGETPDDIEDNLQCALDLKAKRIGHGYALPEKPRIMKEMKTNGVCVEACPISNMVLGLVEHMDEHRIYELLHHEVHCSLNSDNGTLFRSTLSHDFYEVMVGNRNMNLFGWRQLAKWSIEHSCLSDVERERILVEWERRWKEEFIPWITKNEPPARLDKLAKAEENRQKREMSKL